ncbi:MAG: pitrilysin family protein [Patescibacteria group bacterium]
MNNIYKLLKFKNNLKALLLPRPELHSVTLSCWIKVGSNDDPSGKNGLAHLLEHMIIERTAKLDKNQFAETQEQLAGDFVASTGDSSTVIDGTFHYSRLEEALILLKDIIFNRSFPISQISSAKKIVSEEIKQYDDNLAEVISLNAKKIRFNNQSALSCPGYGDKKKLIQINQNDIANFYRKYYLPENIILGLAGKFKVNEIGKRIEKIFGDIIAPTLSAQKIVLPVEFSDRTIKLVSKPYSQIYTIITFPSLSRKSSPLDRLTMNLISFILAGANSSKLYRLLRLNEGLVYDISTETVFEHDYGVFDISWACQPENFPKIFKKVLEELKNFKNGKISSSEIQRFRDILNKDNEMDFDHPSDALDWLLEDLGYENEIVLPEEIIKMRNEITSAKIQEIAKQIFNLKKINIVVVGPVAKLTLGWEKLLI